MIKYCDYIAKNKATNPKYRHCIGDGLTLHAWVSFAIGRPHAWFVQLFIIQSCFSIWQSSYKKLFLNKIKLLVNRSYPSQFVELPLADSASKITEGTTNLENSPIPDFDLQKKVNLFYSQPFLAQPTKIKSLIFNLS